MRKIIILLLAFTAQIGYCQLPDSGIVFNGSSNYYEIPDNVSTDLGGSFTIEAWINPCDTSGHTMILTKLWCNGGRSSYYFSILDGKLKWYWNSNGSCGGPANNSYESTGRIIRNNVWQHVAVVHTATSVSLYYNGVLVTGSLVLGSYTGNLHNSNQPIRVGAYRWLGGTVGAFFNGRMDELRIWHRARTSAQIGANYNSTLVGNETGLRVYHNMDSVSGGTIFNSATFSGSSCNGVGISWQPPNMLNFRNYPVEFDIGNDTLLCSPASLQLSMPVGYSSYLWDNSSVLNQRNVATTGNYIGRAYQGKCWSADTINVSFVTNLVDLGNDTTLCVGDTLAINAALLGATYLWNNGTTNSWLTVTSSGVYSVRVSLVGCFSYDTIVVTFDSLPLVSLGPDTVVCGTQLLLDAGNPGYSYNWSNAAVTQTNLISTPSTYWVDVSNGNCTTRDSISVNFISYSLNLGNDSTLCIGDSLIVNATTPGATYLWSNGVIDSSLVVSSSGVYSVRVNVGGCFAYDTIAVTFNSFPTVNLGPDSMVCGTQLMLDAGNPGYSHSWNTGAISQTNLVTIPNTYWVDVSNGNCTTRDSILINFVSHSLSLGNDTTLCDGDSLILDATTAGGTYLWSNGTTDSLLKINAAGVYSVRVGINGCFSYDTIVISYISFPVVNLGEDTLICGTQLVLDAGNPSYSHSWNTGSVSQTNLINTSNLYWADVSNGSCTTRDSISLSFVDLTFSLGNDTILCENTQITLSSGKTAKSYQWNTGQTSSNLIVVSSGLYALTIIDSFCTATDSILIAFQELNPDFIGLPLSGCEPLLVNFSDASTINFGIISSWEWDFGDGNLSTIQNPTNLYLIAGSYSIRLKVTSSNSCEHDTLLTNYVTVYPLPNANFDVSASPSLVQDLVTFSNKSTDATIYSWYIDDIFVSSSQNHSHSFVNQGIYQIKLIVSNSFGCSDTIVKNVVVNSGNVLLAPNSFTPNIGDDINSYWKIVSNENIKDFDLMIFNRWGELVFRSNDINEGWDGKYFGKDCPNDIYIWKARVSYVNNEVEERFGHINLVR